MIDYVVHQSDMANWNITDNAIKFLTEMVGHNNKSVDIKINITDGESWKYIWGLRRFYGYKIRSYPSLFEWNTKNIGSFLVKNMNGQNGGCLKGMIQDLRQLFTLPSQTVSLQEIALMYSIMDFRELRENSWGQSPNAPPPLLDLKTTFADCFAHSASNLFNPLEMKQQSKSFDHVHINIKTSPCREIDQYPKCLDYCKWHKDYFSKSKFEDFLTIMRYALPQRKIELEPFLPNEKEMAARLFGINRTRNLESSFAPSSMTTFCHIAEKGYIGDDIGLSSPVCNDFFPTPTDYGICLTRNIDLNDIMNVKNTYEQYFELHNIVKDAESSSKWSESTFVIFIDSLNELSQTYPRNSHVRVKDGEIQFQLHQSKEIAKIYLESNYNRLTASMILKANQEYYIDVTPTGQISSVNYKALNLQQRKCHLVHEVSDSSMFKIYTKRNCEYECLVTIAMKECGCIPWDFMANTEIEQCDVFGRTCFFTVIENATTFSNTLCPGCDNECDFVNYNKVITKEHILANEHESEYLDTCACPMVEVYYGTDTQDYGHFPEIFGIFTKSTKFINDRRYYKSIIRNGKYGIWWDGSKWRIGYSKSKGLKIGFGRIEKDTSCLPNITGWDWKLYYGSSGWKDAHKSLGVRCANPGI